MPRETFIDPAGQPFEINTELLGNSNVRGRINERRWWGGERYSIPVTPAEAERPSTRMCLHGNRARFCSSCARDYCGCPGSQPHSCEVSNG